ncbi:hypothetical protein J4219_07680 [Candidatus Woesearchaeota archaeon]|nr:hypothetical protein [Candidatus Woesearchaeota archaeon]
MRLSEKVQAILCSIALSGCSIHFHGDAQGHFHATTPPSRRYEEAPNRQWEQNYRLDWQGRPSAYGRDEDEIQPRYRNR